MNDRLQIAAAAMQTLLKRAKKPFTFQEIAHDALGYADALIAAAGEGGMSEKPTSHSEQIKSDWSLRKFFELQREGYEFGVVRLSIKEQDEICDLVEMHYGYPKPSVPSVEEIFEQAIKCRNVGRFSAEQVANGLHQWLTERNNQK